MNVKVSIRKESNNQTAYAETHTVTSNFNGLITLVVGDGQLSAGSPAFNTIDWGQRYNLLLEIDPNGGTNYSISIEEPIVSVPYALYANEMQEGAFSGDYNDLYNTPVFPVIPDYVSAFFNDPPYVTTFQTEQQIANTVHDSLSPRLENLPSQVLNQEETVDSLMEMVDSIVNGGFLCGLHKGG